MCYLDFGRAFASANDRLVLFTLEHFYPREGMPMIFVVPRVHFISR